MINQNVEEYKLIRTEMNSIKNCITTYASFIIGTSGIGFFILTFIKNINVSIALLTIISMFSALLITSIYYILMYKFISHNRYAGYLRLISQEVALKELPPKRTDVNDILVWELSMCKLQNVRSNPNFPEELWKNRLQFSMLYRGDELDFKNGNEKTPLELLKKVWNHYKIHNPIIDKRSFKKGVIMILKGLFKKDGSKSWKYPLYLTYVVLVFNFMFVALMIYYNIEHNNIFKTFNTLGKVGISLILIIYFFLWYANITELYKVMKGSKTIGAFCWKFLQFRIEALNQFGFIPKYKVMDTHDIPDFKE